MPFFFVVPIWPLFIVAGILSLFFSRFYASCRPTWQYLIESAGLCAQASLVPDESPKLYESRGHLPR